MRLPRLRFTIGQLLMLVAVLAVDFASLRTPFWPLTLLIGPIMPGFAIERARGGPGIVGAMLAGTLTFVGLGLVVLASSPENLSLGNPSILLPIFAACGFMLGAVVGSLAFFFLLLLGYRP